MQQFIGREIWLQRFREYLYQEQGIIWRITGQPGIGKSTLLRRFEYTCEQAECPNVWLDMEGFMPAHGLDVLAAIAGSARFFNTEAANKSLKEKVGEGFKTVTGGLVGALELAKDFIPGGGLAVGAAKVVVGLAEGVAGNAAQISEKEAAAHPELYLLNALAAAGAADSVKKPVCLIDTYEHTLRSDLKINSRLSLGYGQAREGQEKQTLLSVWLADVFEYLKGKGWRIVMVGRSVPRSKAEDNLPRFSRAEMLEAAQSRPALCSYLPTQEDAVLTVLATLSFDGNPLWLQVAMNLLENLLAEGKDLEQLAQQPDELQACFEEEDPFDLGAYEGIEHGRCKLALFNTLTRHIDGLEDQAWKIALPRVLDKGIVLQLFEPKQANAILHNFKLAGVFRDTGQQFTLHEEIRDLLLAYARSKGLLDTNETGVLHNRLWEYLNQTYGKTEENYPAIWMLEAIYHRILSGSGLLENNIDPKTFWWELGGSHLLLLSDKWSMVRDLSEMSQEELLDLQENIVTAKHRLYELLGSATMDKLSQDLRNSVIVSPWELQYWEQRVADYGLPGDYLVLQDIHEQPEIKIQIIDEMLQHFSASTVPEIQVQCAKALISKGWTFREQLNDPQGAVAAYDDLLQHFFDSSIPGVQEQCAWALYSKGWTLNNKLNDSQRAVVVYDQLLQRFSDSTLSGIQEPYAKALVNKGVLLANEFNNPQEAMIIYKQVLQRFANSDLLDIQEPYAKALYNKGNSLDQKFNDPQGAVIHYNQILQRFTDSGLPEVQEICASALLKKGIILDEKLNDSQGALLAYDQLFQSFADSDVPSIQNQRATALFNKGYALNEKLNDPEGAVDAYDQLLQNFVDSDILGVHELCAMALLYKGVTLRQQFNDPAGAVAVYGELLQRFGDSAVPGVQEQCATALVNKGWTLGDKLNDPAGAVAVYGELLQRFGGSAVPGVQERCAKALCNKGIILVKQCKMEEALACYAQLVENYDSLPQEEIQAQCKQASETIAKIEQLQNQDTETAFNSFQETLAQVKPTQQEFAILRFMLWLEYNEKITLAEVLTAICTLSPEVQFTWRFDGMLPEIEQLPEPRKTQAGCFIAFFEQHHDIATLENCLAAVSGFGYAQPPDFP